MYWTCHLLLLYILKFKTYYLMYTIFESYHFMYWKTCWRGSRLFSFIFSDENPFFRRKPIFFHILRTSPLPTPHSYPSVSLSLLRWKLPTQGWSFFQQRCELEMEVWSSEIEVWSQEMEVRLKMGGRDGGLIAGDGSLIENGWRRRRSGRRRRW
jgi:hypothetical protein